MCKRKIKKKKKKQKILRNIQKKKIMYVLLRYSDDNS